MSISDYDYSNYRYIHLINQMALYTILHNATVRQTSEQFNVSKSTVHTYMTKILPQVNLDLYDDVRKVLDNNLSNRAHNAGVASAKLRKYKNT